MIKETKVLWSAILSFVSFNYHIKIKVAYYFTHWILYNNYMAGTQVPV